MDRLECAYRNCDLNFKNETELKEHMRAHIKKRNLSIHLPRTTGEQNNFNQINQTIYQNSNSNNYQPNLISKPPTPFVPNFIDELKSPIFLKESNPFAETFKKALSPLNRITNFDNYDLLNERNNYEDKNESLSTPLIDLKSFEQKIKLKNCSKLDLLITADQLIDNLFDNNLEFNQLDKNQLDKCRLNRIKQDRNEQKCDDKISDHSNIAFNECYNDESKTNASTIKSNENKRVLLPKLDTSLIKQNQQTQPSLHNVSYILRLPNGSSVPISVQPPTNNANIQSSSIVNSLNEQKSCYSQSNSIDSSYNNNLYSNCSTSIHQQINEPSLNKQVQNNKSKTGKKRNSTNKKTTVRKKIKNSEEFLEEKVETTTLKSIKDALTLTESNALPISNPSASQQQINSPFSSTQMSSPYSQTSDTNDLIKYESSYSTSSQSSNSSSLFYQSNKNASTNDFDHVNSQSNLVDINSSCSTKIAVPSVKQSKAGRKCKNQPKEDPNQKKARSLERNRNAAARCRTKRKVWMCALEEKADELEKQNKKLNKDYENLKHDVQKFKTYLIQFTKTTGLLDNNLSSLNGLSDKNLTNSNLIGDNLNHQKVLNSKLNQTINSTSDLTLNNTTNYSSTCDSTARAENKEPTIQTEPMSGKSSNFLDLLLAAAKRENTMYKVNSE